MSGPLYCGPPSLTVRMHYGNHHRMSGPVGQPVRSLTAMRKQKSEHTNLHMRISLVSHPHTNQITLRGTSCHLMNLQTRTRRSWEWHDWGGQLGESGPDSVIAEVVWRLKRWSSFKDKNLPNEVTTAEKHCFDKLLLSHFNHLKLKQDSHYSSS